MKKILSTKTFFWTLLISIIGSALLENIFRNIFNFIGKTALTISTLGIEKYKNDIYLNIARGFYEQVSLKVLSLEVGVLSGVIIGVVFLSFREKEKDENTENSKIKNWARKHKRSVKIIFLAYSFFLISITVLSLVKITYINRSIAYYKQLQSIASPYLTTDEEEKFNSRFSQIQNKEHYIQIINELKKIIGDKNQNLQKSPDFIF